MTRPVELFAPIGISVAIAVLALSDFSLLYAPFAIGLLVAAVGVFWLLAIVVVALLSGSWLVMPHVRAISRRWRSHHSSPRS